MTIRLLDIGGDKPIPYLSCRPRRTRSSASARSGSPATRPDLFLTQLRACYRAAVAGPVKVMAPMVADAADVDVLLALAARARAEAVAAGRPGRRRRARRDARDPVGGPDRRRLLGGSRSPASARTT